MCCGSQVSAGDYLNLNKDVIHVRGATQSAIYDLRRYRLWSVDESATQPLAELLAGVPIQDVIESYGLSEVDEVVAFCVSKGLATRDDEPIHRNAHLQSEPRDLGPEVAWIELGTSCNHKCQHCYNDSGPVAKASIDVEMLTSTIRQLKAAGTRALKFIGGEPLAYRDELRTLIGEAASQRLQEVAVHTNATLLNLEWAQYLRAFDVQVDVTVYGHTADLHEAVTRTPGSFASTRRGLEIATQSGCRVTINVIVVPATEDLLPQILAALRADFPACAVKYDYIRPTGRGVSLYRQMSFKHLNRHQEHETWFDGIGVDDYMRRKHFHPCLGNKISVSGEGQVMPCIMTREVVGDLRHERVVDVLEGALFNKYRTLSLEKLEGCRECEFRYACTDCRPIALGLQHGLLAKPPECRYDPKTGKVAEEQGRKRWLALAPVPIQ